MDFSRLSCCFCCFFWIVSSAGSPIFHLGSNHAGAGDVNGVFFWRGLYHVLSQYSPPGSDCTGWGHAVSGDLITWARLPNALECGPSHLDAGGIFDGSVSFLTVNGTEMPVILYDMNPGKGSAGGDVEVVGIAYPSDPGDPVLLSWTKDPGNPINVTGGCGAGPSNIWTDGGGRMSLMMIMNDKQQGLFNSESLHDWTNVNPAWLPFRGGGGGIFMDLPPSTVQGMPRPHMKILQGDFYGLDGAATLVMADYDPKQQKLNNISPPVWIDWGVTRYSELGLDPVKGRVLHIGWLPKADLNHLSQVRSIQYEPRWDALVSNPVEELAGLRQSLLARSTVTTVHLNAPPRQFPLSSPSCALDVELSFGLPPTTGVSVSLAVMDGDKAAVNASLGIVLLSGVKNTTANVTLSLDFASTGEGLQQGGPPFPLFAGEGSIPIRVMLDYQIVEVFAGFGRSVASFSAGSPQNPYSSVSVAAASASSTEGVVLLDGLEVWSMGSITTA